MNPNDRLTTFDRIIIAAYVTMWIGTFIYSLTERFWQ